MSSEEFEHFSLSTAEGIHKEIKEKLLAFSEREAAHILFKDIFPFGWAYLILDDPESKLLNEIIEVNSKDANDQILCKTDNVLKVNFTRRYQTLEIGKRECEIVQKILSRNGINSTLKEYID